MQYVQTFKFKLMSDNQQYHQMPCHTDSYHKGLPDLQAKEADIPYNCTASLVVYDNPPAMLESLLQSLPDNLHLVVVDNSPKATLARFFAAYPQVTYRFVDRNLGYGKGHNLAVQLAGYADFHLVINPDIIMSPDSLPRMVAYLQQHPDIGLLAPKILNSDGSIQYLNRRKPTVLDILLRRLPDRLLTTGLKQRMAHHEMRDTDYTQLCEVESMSGAFMLLRRAAFEQAGGFDPRYFMYFEDFDLCNRLQQAGFATVYYPFASVTHLWQRASARQIRMTLTHICSMIHYFNKWGWQWY